MDTKLYQPKSYLKMRIALSVEFATISARRIRLLRQTIDSGFHIIVAIATIASTAGKFEHRSWQSLGYLGMILCLCISRNNNRIQPQSRK